MLLLVYSTKEIINAHIKGIGEFSQILERRRTLARLEVRDCGRLQPSLVGEVQLTHSTVFARATKMIFELFRHEKKCLQLIYVSV